MAQKNRATLKSYFQQGDIPTENEYIDLIDSIPSFQDHNSGDLKITGSLDILGNITASNVLLDWSGSGVTGGLLDGVYRINTQLIGSANGTNITFMNEIDFNNQNLLNIDIGSGDINNTSIGTSTPSSGSFTTLSSTGNTNLGNSTDDQHFFIGGVTGSSFLVQDVNGKGDFYAHEITVGDRSSNSNALTISTSGSLFASSSITSSANISASGTLYGSEAYITGHITASGNISASGTIFADNFQSTGGDVGGISFADEVNITGNITASGNISSSGTVFANALDLEGANIKYIASQNILKFGDAIKLGIGAGITEAVGDLTISSDGANATLNANVGNVTLSTSAGDTIIKNSFANGNILLQSDKSGGGQQGGVVLISGSNTHISLDVRGNITASNISASGTLFANTLNASELTGITHITASGNISASGNITAITASIQHLDGPEGGEISFFGGNPTLKGEDGAKIEATDSVTISGGNNELIVGTIRNVNTTHVTASGNISSSGTINTQTLKVNDLTDGRVTFSSTNGRLADDSDLTFSNQTLTVTKIANIDTTHITASGNISSSGKMIADSGRFSQVIIDGETALDTTDSAATGRVFSDAQITKIQIGKPSTNTSTVIEGPITASGAISASGNLTANQANIIGHITASGNISSSGTGSFGYVEASGLVNRANDANTGLEFSSDTVVIQGNNVHAALFSSTLNRFIVPTEIQAPLTASGDISSSGTLTTGTTIQLGGNHSDNIRLKNYIQEGVQISNGDGSTIYLTVNGGEAIINLSLIPTSDPNTAGQLFRDGTDLKISLG